MTVAAFLVALVGPIMARWLAAMGMSLVTLAGLSAATTSLKAYITNGMAGFPLAAAQLAGLYGVWEAVGLILGALTFVLTWNSTRGFWALAKGSA